jgi:hypothetical protein
VNQTAGGAAAPSLPLQVVFRPDGYRVDGGELADADNTFQYRYRCTVVFWQRYSGTGT